MHHHHHVHVQKVCCCCLPLKFGNHIIALLDIFAVIMAIYGICDISTLVSESLKTEDVKVSVIGTFKISNIYRTIILFFIATLVCCSLPRTIFYFIYLFSKGDLKKLNWYMLTRIYSFFVNCFLSAVALIIIFLGASVLTNSFGSSVGLVLILFMTPITLLLILDFYLCTVTKYYFEERVW